MKIKAEIKKIDFKVGGNWNNWDNMRKDNGVMQALEETAKQIGDIDTKYKNTSRCVVGVKTDKETLDRLGIETKEQD